VKHTLSFYRESKTPVAVSIAEVLENILELQSRNIQLQGISREKRYEADATVHGFPGELRQVFMNLIVNAIQSMPEGGRLRIGVRKHTDLRTLRPCVSVSICDTGSGISPEHAKELFEPFFTTKSTKGTGLGLWISKGIVQKYDGTIRFRSIRKSNGHTTGFRVVMPGQTSLKKLDSVAAYSALSN